MERPRRRKKLEPGRPRKPVRKEIVIGTRFSKAEHFVVKEKASKAGLKPSEYVRTICIHGEVKARINEEERHFVRQLIGMANNINQLTKMANQQGILRIAVHFEKYRTEIDQLLKALRHDK